MATLTVSLSRCHPLATQQALAAEIEAEQSLVTANRQLIRPLRAGRFEATVGRVWGDNATQTAA